MNRIHRGMTLVEITIVLTVLLVILGAVFLFFTRGSEEFDFARRQNELITTGRLALEEVTDIILYAGYMPSPDWSNDNWHPVVLADSIEFEFYADYGDDGVLDDTDYRNIEVINQRFVVTDHGSYVHRIGSNISSLDFSYLDELSNPLPEPLSATDRDLVRHIQINLILVGEYRNKSYYTNVSTTISPRNLGVNHNINPAFAPPDPLEGTTVFNVCGADTIPAPNPDEILMISRMVDWGLTMVPLTDLQMATYDFIGKKIVLIVLRHRGPTESFPYPALFYNYTGIGDTLHIPVVTLNSKDAVDIFSMGKVALDTVLLQMTPANDWHPVNYSLPNGYTTFNVYNPTSTGMQSVLDSIIYPSPGDTLLTYPDTLYSGSGVCVRDENSPRRRVHFSAYDASEFTADGGWRIFYNVIKWAVGSKPSLGTVVEEEDFESPDDYSSVDPGYGEDSYCYVVTPRISIPKDTVPNYDAILRFSHCGWTRNRQCGGYLDISTDSVNWTQIPDSLLLEKYNTQQTMSGFPGGAGIDAYISKFGGYETTKPELTFNEVCLEDYRDADVWVRWVFGVEAKISNNQDGWVFDDPVALLVNTDPTATPDSIRIDPWASGTMIYQPRYWKHHNFPTFNDDWYYHNLHAVDSIYAHEQGYAWTTWGEIGYIGPWEHGGTNDSWEIGVSVSPFFVPDPDPSATPQNGSHYCGNDLTYDDGFYNDYETSYLLSKRFDISNTSSYSIINLEFYRCVRLASNDDGWVHLGFSTDTLPPDPMNLGSWYEVADYPGSNHTNWEYQVANLSQTFTDALADSAYQHYWIAFTIISGPSLVRGGWNVDNIKIWGDNI